MAGGNLQASVAEPIDTTAMDDLIERITANVLPLSPQRAGIELGNDEAVLRAVNAGQFPA